MSVKVFVSFGTHEQPFTRLMDMLVELSEKRAVSITIQAGYTQVPKALLNSKNKTVMQHSQYLQAVRDCDVFITQSSPGNVFGALELEKLAVVVPRLVDFGEHVDSHQMLFGQYLTASRISVMAENSNELIERFDQLLALGVNGQRIRTEELLEESREKTAEFISKLTTFLNGVFDVE
jgi:UDP-N-acetylglucosamine transferase subunit ALG13